MAGNSKKRKLDPSAQKYYAVRAGKQPGVYLTWAECQAQTAGFKGAVYKSFLTRDDAQAFAEGRKVASDSQEDPKFYAVAVGNPPGIYTDWADASPTIANVKGPKYKKFESRREAIDFIRENGNAEALKWLAEQTEGKEPALKKTRAGTGAAVGETSAAKSTRQSATMGMADASVVVPGELDLVHVYTDGSSRSNGRANAVAGVGVYFGPGDSRNVSERLAGPLQTNNRAELTAILRAMEQLPNSQGIKIYSDSNYAIKCVSEWYRNWQRNNWRKSTGDPVENNDLIKAIRAKIESRDAAAARTIFQWVKGHASEVGNIAADRLAVEGATRRT